MKGINSVHYGELRQYLEKLPVIDTHEHYVSYQTCEDPMDFLLNHSLLSDFWSAGGEQITGSAVGAFSASIPKNLPERERYNQFKEIYQKIRHTSYARAWRQMLKQGFSVDDVGTYEEYHNFVKAFSTRNEADCARLVRDSGIKMRIVDRPDFDEYLDGNRDYSADCRFALYLYSVCRLRSKKDMARMQKYLDREMVCLDDYTEAFDRYLDKSRQFGIVCFKEVAAYERTLAYTNPSKAEAEKVFAEMVFSPREMFGDARTRVLSDWLFQYTMKKAAQYGLPVQIHTGLLCDSRNDIVKANAVNLQPTLELHKWTKFDLFHGNWPYMDEYLFLGKNYPNVRLNLCWVHQIDPLYTVELIKRAMMTVPHSKVFAFGGDTSYAETAVANLSLARDNVACAFAELVDCGWLTVEEAKAVSKDWFFNNANEFYGLGYDRI